jgi:4-amino-4-deoxy-L-arabinose transferase-like glycosyltransferase
MPADSLPVANTVPPLPPPVMGSRIWAMLILLLLTVAGGVIRFLYLDQPALWGDEARVYWRICGTYGQMLEPLKDDGFVPLHYELNWVIGHFYKPTPFVIRFVPALCGTLFIPAIYFLARQLLQRSTSLLVAALGACSAFLIFYSRDAKMYMDTWLFMTLNAACVLWWMRTRSSTAWLCWVASGCAACGLHPTSMVVVGISLLMLLTQKNLHWKQAVWWVVGVLIIVAGPVGYYTKFNTWNQRVEERGWNTSGIEWVDWDNRGKDGIDLVRSAATSYLMGWGWPQPEEEKSILPWLVSGPKLCSQILLTILIVALFPWPLVTRPRRDIDPPPQPQWRIFLWLGAWIALPAYVFYCHSIEAFYSPVDWLTTASVPTILSRHPWLWYAMGIVAVAGVLAAAVFITASRPMILRGLQWTVTAVALWGACFGIFKICVVLSTEAQLANRAWHSIWIPRYLGFIWPAITMATAAIIMRLPTRPVRAAAIFFLLGINLAFGAARVFAGTEPPVDRMAVDAYAGQDLRGTVATYVDVRRGDPNPGGGTLLTNCGKYYLQMLAWAQPMTPDLFMGSLSDFRLRRNADAREIAQEITRSKRTDRLIVWDEIPENIVRETDTLGPMLKGWKIVHEDWYPVRRFWDFQDHGNFRRREYVRVFAIPTKNGRQN